MFETSISKSFSYYYFIKTTETGYFWVCFVIVVLFFFSRNRRYSPLYKTRKFGNIVKLTLFFCLSDGCFVFFYSCSCPRVTFGEIT